MKNFYIISIAALLTCTSCVSSGNAGSPPAAGANPSQAANDINHINTTGWADSPYVSLDGQSLYFMYSRYNFFPAILNEGSPTVTGPTFPGHHKNDVNPFWDSDIYVSHRKPDGSWGPPENMPGVNDDKDNCCAMVVSTPPARIYYQRETGKPNDIDIAYRDLTPNGAGALQFFPPEVNSPYMDDNPHVSADHRRVYFSSTRPGGEGDKDIWFSYKDEQGHWSNAINLGPMINTDVEEDQYWMSETPDAAGRYEVYFNRKDVGIMRTTWSETEGYAQPVKVDLGVAISGEASLTADGKEMFYASPDIQEKRIRIFFSRRNPDGSWSKGMPVD